MEGDDLEEKSFGEPLAYCKTVPLFGCVIGARYSPLSSERLPNLWGQLCTDHHCNCFFSSLHSVESLHFLSCTGTLDRGVSPPSIFVPPVPRRYRRDSQAFSQIAMPFFSPFREYKFC